MNKTCAFCFSFVLLFYLEGILWSMAQEDIGNKPLHKINYRDWPGIMPVINHSSRVYHIWVNGHETFYYEGNAEEFNNCLVRFSRTGYRVLEVLIRPGPASKVKTFKGDDISYGWELELMGGISKHLTTEDRGDKIWSPYPMLTVYVSDIQTLTRMEIPPGIKILELADLKNRYFEGLSSKEHHVRGWGAARLARLDPYDPNSIANIAVLLEDDDWWVRLCAVGALQRFDKKAQPVIPRIQACVDTERERLKDKVEKVVKSIQSAKTDTKKETRHKKMLITIRKYVDQWHRKSEKKSDQQS